MSLTIKDLEKLQSTYPDYQMESVGRIIIMGLLDFYTSKFGARLIRFLGESVDPRRLRRSV